MIPMDTDVVIKSILGIQVMGQIGQFWILFLGLIISGGWLL